MIKKTLIPLFSALIIFLFIDVLQAQTFYFCEGVDKSGYPITESDVFNIPSSGGFLYFLTRLPYDLNCRSVRYEIYKIDSRGYETYFDTQYQDTEKDWQWFWKKYTFYSTGRYNVYVYDCYDYLLTSGSVKINWQ